METYVIMRLSFKKKQRKIKNGEREKSTAEKVVALKILLFHTDLRYFGLHADFISSAIAIDLTLTHGANGDAYEMANNICMNEKKWEQQNAFMNKLMLIIHAIWTGTIVPHIVNSHIQCDVYYTIDVTFNLVKLICIHYPYCRLFISNRIKLITNLHTQTRIFFRSKCLEREREREVAAIWLSVV